MSSPTFVVTEESPSVKPAIATSAAIVNATRPAAMSNLAAANTVANNGRAGQNALANQQAISQIGLAAVGKAVQMVSELGALTVRSAQEVLESAIPAGEAGRSINLLPMPPMPLGPGVWYARMPLYLIYDNNDGMGNIKEIVVNSPPNPIPSGATIYVKAPTYLVYEHVPPQDSIQIKPLG